MQGDHREFRASRRIRRCESGVRRRRKRSGGKAEERIRNARSARIERARQGFASVASLKDSRYYRARRATRIVFARQLIPRSGAMRARAHAS